MGNCFVSKQNPNSGTQVNNSQEDPSKNQLKQGIEVHIDDQEQKQSQGVNNAECNNNVSNNNQHHNNTIDNHNQQQETHLQKDKPQKQPTQDQKNSENQQKEKHNEAQQKDKHPETQQKEKHAEPQQKEKSSQHQIPGSTTGGGGGGGSQEKGDSYYGSLKDPEGNMLPKRKEIKVKKVRDDIEEEAQIFEKIKKINREMTGADIHANKKALGNHFVFSLLSDQDKEIITKKMFYCENSEEFIFKQNDQASSYFIIEKGECQIIINGEVKKTISHGNCFGELALLYGSPRSASVKALGICGFWAIDRNTFKKAIADIVHREYSENRAFIEKIKFFNSMTVDQKDAIANVLITQVFKKGEIIVNHGDMATSYYIIKKGQVAIYQGEKELRKMGVGETFGEQALFENATRGATVKAIEDDSRCIALGKDTLQAVLGDRIQVIINNNMMRWAFENNPTLKNLTLIQREKIVNNSEQKNYKKDEVFLESGTIVNKIVFVLEGGLKYKDNQQVVAEKGTAFGDQWLYAKNKNDKVQKTIIFSENSLLAEISLKQLFECIGGPIEVIFEKNKDSHEVKYMKRANSKEINKYQHLKLEEMISIKKLGFGQFGSVFLVKSKMDNEYYALKCIQKAQVIEQSLEKHLLQEKKVLESAQFPLIMKFMRSFKDQNNIYFLNEYVKGMELFDVIREIGLLNVQESQFYIGSLILCMEYLHTNNIIYRDIKPENVMVDHKGYVKLIDMGTAKFLKGKGGKTFTIIGTPHYMAPEIITGKGYTYNVDLWSIGICLYEFMCGAVPFAEDAEDPYEIYEEIMKKSIQYPGFLKDKNSKSIINQLLNKTPELRIGGSYAALKANPWFDNFDFDKLLEKQLKVPYIPPKDKIITDGEIRKQENLGRLVMDDLKNENQQKYKKENAKDPNWDKDF